jgi:hypothetical protein
MIYQALFDGANFRLDSIFRKRLRHYGSNGKILLQTGTSIFRVCQLLRKEASDFYFPITTFLCSDTYLEALVLCLQGSSNVLPTYMYGIQELVIPADYSNASAWPIRSRDLIQNLPSLQKVTWDTNIVAYPRATTSSARPALPSVDELRQSEALRREHLGAILTRSSSIFRLFKGITSLLDISHEHQDEWPLMFASFTVVRYGVSENWALV